MEFSNSISRRISQINDVLFGGNNSEFARIVGIGESNVRSYLGGTMPKADVLEKIAINTVINCEWLLTGNGVMLKESEESAEKNSPLAERYLTMLEDSTATVKSQQETIRELTGLLKERGGAADAKNVAR